MRTPARSLFPLALLLAAGAAQAARPHQHGAAQAQVTLEGARLTVAVQLPQHDLLGFERPPRSDGERRAADALRQRLADPATLVHTATAAGCRADAPVVVDAPMLAPGAQGRTDGHADIDASVELQCTQPAALKRVELGLFDAFPRLSRIEVQMVGPRGQSKATLRRPNATVTLQP